MGFRRFASIVLLGSFCVAAMAGTAHGVAAGGRIPPDPNTTGATSGTLTSDIVIPNAGKVAAGNAITVNLLGLQHDWAGDLIVTLSYVDAQGHTVLSRDLINRIGQSTGNFGAAADFGTGNGTGDNYLFNTDYASNIWSNAGPLGDADAIPGQTNDVTNGGKYFSSTVAGVKTQLSYDFAGLDVSAGTWRLTIADAADPNTGSFVGWEIFIQTTPSISPNAGTPQSATVNATFTTALQAKVADASGVSGVTVTFTAPSTGASGTFTTTGTNVATAVTDGSGVATAPAFMANGTAGGPYTVTATATGVAGSASFSLTNAAGPPALIQPVAGTPQSAAVSSPFGTQLQAKVTDASSNPLNGIVVTFTAPSTGASGTFAGTGTNTATAPTNASGVATAPVFTGNGTAGSYTVTGSATGAGSTNFALTNTATISIVRNAAGCYAAVVQGEPAHATTWSINPQFGMLRVVPFWIGVTPSSKGSAVVDQYDLACYVPATSGTFPDHVTLTATSSADATVTTSINIDPHTGLPK
jgi:subtilisin-like proprotein convertase family protein